jgi:predicted phosphodiesterase
MTRYAVLSDIHANFHALTAVLRALTRKGVDHYVCAGDLVGYGPMPNECVELLASLPATCVAGNHELVALGQLADDRCSPSARHSLEWTRTVLRDDVAVFLRGLPWVTSFPGIVVAHGSLDDSFEYVLRPAQADEQLQRLTEGWHDASILILGHTHRQWAYCKSGGTQLAGRPGTVVLGGEASWLLNPGSVGQSRDWKPHARFLILDDAERWARFFSIPYDVRGCRATLRRHGLPADSCHYRPDVLRETKWALGRVGRRGLRRLRRGPAPAS